MATFKFLKQNNGASILKDGVEIHNVTKPLDDIKPSDDGLVLLIQISGLVFWYVKAGNNFIINKNDGAGDVDVTANTLIQICDNLRDNIFIF